MVLLQEIDDTDDDPVDHSQGNTIPNETPSHPAQEILDLANDDPSKLPDAIHQILTETIKPLFSKHPDLTSTGRKNLVPSKSTGPFIDSVFDKSRPWKTTSTIHLIHQILDRYNLIDNGDDRAQQSVLEAHFHLLVPPILHFLDDSETPYKIEGCRYLAKLCLLLRHSGADILRRTGLTEVFIDALRKTFTHLPSLTPEAESLDLMQAVYPAYLALVDARFGALDAHWNRKASLDNYAITGVKHEEWTQAGVLAEITARQGMLTVLLRHSLVYSLSHLSTGTLGGTTSVGISAFLLSQIPGLVERMGIRAAEHLQTLVPLLKGILMDPFVVSAPDMLFGTLAAMQAIIKSCWIRVRERWWSDCLAGLDMCWLNVLDEISGCTNGQAKVLGRVQDQLKDTVTLLEAAVGRAEFVRARDDLLAEEASLHGLFKVA